MYFLKSHFQMTHNSTIPKELTLFNKETYYQINLSKYLPYILEMTSEEIYMERENVILKDNENFEYL